MIFATDLDNTMIFSHRTITGKEDMFDCVEHYQGREITYMTPSAIQKLKFLMNSILVIPVTTRSLTQFNRVHLFQNTKYAIIDNGGMILHNGIIDANWDNHVNAILKQYDFEKVYHIFATLPTLISFPKIIDGKFIFAKVDDIDICKKILKYELDTKIWQLSFQGKKVYAIPAEITKGNALKYISEYFLTGNQTIIAAGDSNLDVSMLEYSNYGIIPSDCELEALNKFIKTKTGINSADSILDFVLKLNFIKKSSSL